MSFHHRSVPMGVDKWKRGSSCSKINKNKWTSKYTRVRQSSQEWGLQGSVCVIETVTTGLRGRKSVQLKRDSSEGLGGRADDCVNSNVCSPHPSVSPKTSAISCVSVNPYSKRHFPNNQLKTMCLPKDISSRNTVTVCDHDAGLNRDSSVLNKLVISTIEKNKTNEEPLLMDDNHVSITSTVDEATCNFPVSFDEGYAEAKHCAKSGVIDQKSSKKLPKRVKRQKTMYKTDCRKSENHNVQFLSRKKWCMNEKMQQELQSESKVVRKTNKNKNPSFAVLAAAAVQQTKKGKHTTTDNIISLNCAKNSPRRKNIENKQSSIDSVESSEQSVIVSSAFSDCITQVLPSFNDQSGQLIDQSRFSTNSRKAQPCKSSLQKQTSKTALLSSDYPSSSPENIIKRRRYQRCLCKPRQELPESDTEPVPLSDSTPKSSRVSVGQDKCGVIKPTVPLDNSLTCAVSPMSESEVLHTSDINIDHQADAASDLGKSSESKLDVPNLDLVKDGLFWKEEYSNGLNRDRFLLVALPRLEDETLLTLAEGDSDCCDIYSISSDSSFVGVNFSFVDQDAVKDADSNDYSTFSEGESEMVGHSPTDKGSNINMSVGKHAMSIEQLSHNEEDVIAAPDVDAGLGSVKDTLSTFDQCIAINNKDKYLYSKNCEMGTNNFSSLVVERFREETTDNFTSSEVESRDKAIGQVTDNDFSSLAKKCCVHHLISDEKNFTTVNYVSPTYSDSHYRESVNKVHSQVVGADCVCAVNDGNNIKMTLLCEQVNGDIFNADQLDADNDFSLAVREFCENDLSKKHVSCDSLQDNPSNKEREPQNVMDIENTVSSTKESTTTIRRPFSECPHIRTSVPESSSSDVMNSSSNINADVILGDSHSSVQEYEKTVTSDHKATSSFPNTDFSVGRDENGGETSMFYKCSSDQDADESLNSGSGDNGLPGAAEDVDCHVDELICSPSMFLQQKYQLSLNAELEFSVENISKHILSSCQYDGVEYAQTEAGDSDTSKKCRKNLEDMLNSLREVDAWTSSSDVSLTDSLAHKSVDSLSDIVVDDMVISDSGIDCNVSVSADDVKGDCFTQEDDLYLLQEALNCLGTGMFKNDKTSGDNTLGNSDKNSGHNTLGTNDNISGENLLDTDETQTNSAIECPKRKWCQEISVNSQKELNSDSFVVEHSLYSMKMAAVPNPEIKVVLERLDLENIGKIGDMHLDRIGSSWKVRYDNKPPIDKMGRKLPEEKISVGSTLSRDKIGNNSPLDKVGSNSPLDNVGSNSPMDKVGSNSPLDNVGSNSPIDKVGSNSPLDKVDSNSPMDKVGGNSPDDKMGCESPEDKMSIELAVDEIGIRSFVHKIGSISSKNKIGGKLHYKISNKSPLNSMGSKSPDKMGSFSPESKTCNKLLKGKMCRKSPEGKIGRIRKPVKMKSDKRGRPPKAKQIGDKKLLKESAFQKYLNIEMELEKGKPYCKRSTDEVLPCDKSRLYANIDSESERSLTSPHKMEKDVFDSSEFGKAITASESKTKKSKKPKVCRQSSTENQNEIDKSQDYRKSEPKVAFPLDILGKPKSKLAQKILRQRDKEKLANKKSSSFPSLEIAPFKDIISSSSLNLSDSSAFGFPPKVTFGRSFRKSDQSKLNDSDSDRHRSPLDLCVDVNDNTRFKTIDESQVSVFKSPKSPKDRQNFVFGDTSLTNEALQGKNSSLDVPEDTDSLVDSPYKDSTVKSELLSRLESVLNSSSSSVISSPTSPRSSTPLTKRRKQQIVMFSPIVRSTSANITKEAEVINVSSGLATKSILKNSTSNILAELKSGYSALTGVKQIEEKSLKIQDPSCSDSLLSMDSLGDDCVLGGDCLQGVGIEKDFASVAHLDDSTADLVSCTLSTEFYQSSAEEDKSFQQCFAESPLFPGDNILMAPQSEAESGGSQDISHQEIKDQQSDSGGSRTKNDKDPYVFNNTENLSLDTAGLRNTTSYVDVSCGDIAERRNGLVQVNCENITNPEKGSSLMNDNLILSSEDNTSLGKGLDQMDDNHINRETDMLESLTDNVSGTCVGILDSTKLEYSPSIKDGNHNIISIGHTTKLQDDEKFKDNCMITASTAKPDEKVSSTDDIDITNCSNESALQLTNISSISVSDDHSQESHNLPDDIADLVSGEEVLEGYASQVEGSLLGLSLESENLSSLGNSEADVGGVELDFVRCFKHSDEVPEVGNKAKLSSVVKAVDEVLKDGAESDSNEDSSGDHTDVQSSASSARDSSGTATQDHTADDDKTDDEDDAISLLAPSEASFLSDCVEDAEESKKSIKTPVKMVAANQVPNLKSGIAKSECISSEGEMKAEQSGKIKKTVNKEKPAPTDEKSNDKALINKDVQIQQTINNYVETLRGLVEQKNLFRCLDVLKRVENTAHLTGRPVDLPVDIQMGVLEISIDYGYTVGAFHIMNRLYSKPHLLTTEICNRVLRMCHPFRRDRIADLYKMFDTMRDLNIMPNIDCLVSLIRAFIESESWEKVWEVLKYAAECSELMIPTRVQEMALQVCLNKPEQYATFGIQWLRGMLGERFVEYLPDVNHNILVDLAEMCIGHHERDAAVQLKSAVSPTLTICIGFEDEEDICPVYSDELKAFAVRIKGCGLTENWRYLAQTFIDVCASFTVNNRQLLQIYCDVLLHSKSTQQIVYSFTEFLRDVVKEFERDRHDNPHVTLDYSTIGQIGRSLLFHCYHGNNLSHCYTLLSKLLEFKLPCRSRNPAVDQQFLTVAMETCIHMDECRLCVQIFEGFNWQAENMASVDDLSRFLFLVMKLLNQFLVRGDCKSAARILSLILCQKEVCETSIMSEPEFTSLQNNLICKAVNMGDMVSAVKMFNLHVSAFCMQSLETQTLRLLVVSCAETGLVAEARHIFNQCKKLSIYSRPSVVEVPRELRLSSRLTPAEVLLVIEDFLQEIYGYLCSQTLDGRTLTWQELELSLKMVMYGTEIVDDPYLSVFPRSVPAAQNMVLSIVRQDLEPPLAATVVTLGLIEINCNTLQIYLQALDHKGNRQGLHFTRLSYLGAPPIAPMDQDISKFRYDQRIVGARPVTRGAILPHQRFGITRPPNPSAVLRGRGTGTSLSHSHTYPPPFETMTFPNPPPSNPPPFEAMTFPNPPLSKPLLHLPDLMQEMVLPPNRFDVVSSSGACPPRMAGGPRPQMAGRDARLERPVIQSQQRPPRGRGMWGKKNTPRNTQ
ncbi:uncharacterized protein LOC121384232 [Gigantopelta aegis]|uniref:uncharacterized protein LOC121384232 n=1 Tax=Gigantopelta aegis TaxID=1735272 RepID=UPI001B8893BA|nr:uncharacterized protein LOC121384232 [Gigantopelta aegis]